MVSVSNKSSSSGMGSFVSATLRTWSWPPPCRQQQRDEHGDVMCWHRDVHPMAIDALFAHHTGTPALSRHQRVHSGLNVQSAGLGLSAGEPLGMYPKSDESRRTCVAILASSLAFMSACSKVMGVSV